MPCRLMLVGALLSSFLAIAPFSARAADATFEFAAPPATNLLRIYRVNRSTGEMGACEFVPKAGTIGTTICYPAGDGGGSQADGDYGLVASNFAQEGGIIRVNRRTGEVSVCYVLNGGVVCTAPVH
jgi:hypothetical protein